RRRSADGHGRPQARPTARRLATRPMPQPPPAPQPSPQPRRRPPAANEHHASSPHPCPSAEEREEQELNSCCQEASNFVRRSACIAPLVLQSQITMRRERSPEFLT